MYGCSIAEGECLGHLPKSKLLTFWECENQNELIGSAINKLKFEECENHSLVVYTLTLPTYAPMHIGCVVI